MVRPPGTKTLTAKGPLASKQSSPMRRIPLHERCSPLTWMETETTTSSSPAGGSRIPAAESATGGNIGITPFLLGWDASRIAAYGTEILPAFEGNLALLQRAFELGEVDLLQVLVARERLLILIALDEILADLRADTLEQQALFPSAHGHAAAVAEQLGHTGTLIAIDRDPHVAEFFRDVAREAPCTCGMQRRE